MVEVISESTKKVIRDITSSLFTIWFGLNKRLVGLKFFFLFFVLTTIPFSFLFAVIPKSLFWTLAALGLCLSGFWLFEKRGRIAFIFGLIFLALVSPLTALCIGLILSVMLYYVLKDLKLSSLKRLASKTPAEIAGVEFETPQLEITIRPEGYKERSKLFLRGRR